MAVRKDGLSVAAAPTPAAADWVSLAQVNPDLPWARPFTGSGFFRARTPHRCSAVNDDQRREALLWQGQDAARSDGVYDARYPVWRNRPVNKRRCARSQRYAATRRYWCSVSTSSASVLMLILSAKWVTARTMQSEQPSPPWSSMKGLSVSRLCRKLAQHRGSAICTHPPPYGQSSALFLWPVEQYPDREII